MKRGSSGHFAKGGSGYFYHNDRSHTTANSIFNDEENEVSCSADEVMKIYREELSIRAKKYTERTGQKLQKNFVTHRSLIVNLEDHHTLKDLIAVKKHIEKSLDTKVLQIAIHRDEGYVDKDTGEEIKNYHAHIEIMGLDSQGVSIAQHQNKATKHKATKTKIEETRENRLDGKFYSKFQTYLAKELQMERGKRGSKAKRLDTYEYKHEAEIRSDLVREAKTKELAKIKDVKAQFKIEKAELVKSGEATKEQHTELRAKYKELEEQARKKDLTIQELESKSNAVVEYKNEKLCTRAELEETKSGLFKKYDTEKVIDLLISESAKVKRLNNVQNALYGELEETKQELRVLQFDHRIATPNTENIEKVKKELSEALQAISILEARISTLQTENGALRADMSAERSTEVEQETTATPISRKKESTDAEEIQQTQTENFYDDFYALIAEDEKRNTEEYQGQKLD